MMKMGIIDLGSNSFYLAVYEVARDGVLHPLLHRSNLNRLGQYLAADGRIPDTVCHESGRVVAALCEEAIRAGATVVKAFGTGIFRRAKNSAQLVDEIFRSSGVVVDVLTEREETAIIFEAARAAYGLAGQSLVLDIGGGSSECIVARRGRMAWHTSVPMGTSVMLGMLARAAGNDRTAIEENILATYRRRIVQPLRKKTFDACFGTSGFVRCIARWLRPTVATCLDFATPVTITAEEITRVLDTSRTWYGGDRHESCSNLPVEQQAIVYAGSLVLDMLMRELAIVSITVSAVSSREGYAQLVIRKLQITNDKQQIKDKDK